MKRNVRRCLQQRDDLFGRDWGDRIEHKDDRLLPSLNLHQSELTGEGP
jgi:hypothetical protein